MMRRVRELLMALGSLGLGYEIVVQGGSRPEVMTAMISLIATAGALKADEARKDAAKPAPPPPPPPGARRVRRVIEEEVLVDEHGNVIAEG